MKSLHQIHQVLVTIKSIIGGVIPELEDIAEEQKNQLRSANIILQDALEIFPQPIREKSIPLHIVQFEHSGIPEAPYITLDMDKALSYFEAQVVKQGYRAMKEGETINHYLIEYQTALDDNHPNLKPDDTVRWWEVEIE